MPNFKAPKPEKDYFQKPNFYPADLRYKMSLFLKIKNGELKYKISANFVIT